MPSNQSSPSLGKYQLKALIKQGTIATVHRAFDAVLERDVAIKILNENVLTGDNAEALNQHFAIAAKAAAQCQQPNVVSVHDYAQHEQRPYIVMDYLSGGNLDNLLKKQSLNQEQAIKLMLIVLEALHGLHQQGVIHSGIKPSTILLPIDFSSNIAFNLHALKITAFGTAFITNNVANLHSLDNLCLYSAPELRHGNPISVRSDLYAVAAVLLQLLLQKPLSPELFDDDTLQQALHGKKVTANLIQIVSQSLNSKPQQRYYDALEFHQALSRYLTEQNTKAVPKAEPAAIVKAAQPIKPSEPAQNELALQREITLIKENALQRERELEATLQIKESQWQTQMAQQQRTAAHTEAALQDELAFYKEAVSKQKEAYRLRSSKSIGEQVVKSSGSFWREILVISLVIGGGAWTFLHEKEPEESPPQLEKMKLQPIAKSTARTAKNKNETPNNSLSTEENTTPISEIARLIERRYHIKTDVIDDLNTGLTWMRCSLGQKWDNGQCTGEPKGYSLEQVTYLSQTTKPDSWRLPTREELLTLVYCNDSETSVSNNDGCGASHVMPTIIDSVFPKTPSFSFWAHTPNATEYGVWGAVEFVNGSYNEVSKNEVFYVRMVRER